MTEEDLEHELENVEEVIQGTSEEYSDVLSTMEELDDELERLENKKKELLEKIEKQKKV